MVGKTAKLSVAALTVAALPWAACDDRTLVVPDDEPDAGAAAVDLAPARRWNVVHLGDTLLGVWGSDEALYVVGNHGIHRSVDHGATWEHTYDAYLRAVWGSAASDVYAVGDHGRILHSVDRGANWTPGMSGVDVALNSVWGSGPDDVYVVGENGVILHSGDRGASWTRQVADTTSYVFRVWGSSPDDVYAVEGYTRGMLLHTSDRGATWGRQPIGAAQLFGVWGSGRDDVYLVGYQDGAHGTILHSADRGATWSTQSVTTNLWAVAGSGHGDVYAVGWGGPVYHSINEGASWTPEGPDGVGLLNVWVSADGEVFGVDSNGTLLHGE
jgi:photosystem II stability/assembly factor-like uncharacterized protein